MEKLVECALNVSEGRREAVIRQIAQSIRAVEGSYLLHFTSDFDHHRSVFTFAGGPASIEEAAWQAIQCAVSLIDARGHRGVHPRVGAVDVVPFIPLEGVSIKDCVKIARHLGGRVGQELQIPVFLYEKAAFPGRETNLAEIRRGQIEGLRQRIGLSPSDVPDYGPVRLHPTAGAMVIGARDFLVAFNVYLTSSDLEIASEIARRIRERDGGLPGVKALGFYIEKRRQVQVSINITDLKRASLAETFDAVTREAQRLGTEVDSSEIIGLVPERALPKDLDGLKLQDRVENHILESALEKALGSPKIRLRLGPGPNRR